MSEWLQDLRYGARMVVKRPGTAAIAIIALALGIGLTTTMFSIVEGVILRGLPYEESDRLVAILRGRTNNPSSRQSVPLHDFVDWRARQQSFSSLGVARQQSFNFVTQGEAERLAGALATHDLFTAFGVSALRGRLFTANDDKPGAERTVVIRESLWQRAFGGRDSFPAWGGGFIGGRLEAA